MSAPGAAGYAGVAYFAAMATRLGHDVLIDCGDDAGLVLTGIRLRAPLLLFAGAADVAAKLADMGARNGCSVVAEPGAPVLVLAPRQRPAPALEKAARGDAV